MKAICFLLALAFMGQELNVTPQGNAYVTGTTSSIGGGALLAGQSASGTASVPGVTTVGKPCIAMPSDGTLLSALGTTVSLGCVITSSGTATVSISAAIAGTPLAKTYTVIAFP